MPMTFFLAAVFFMIMVWLAMCCRRCLSKCLIGDAARHYRDEMDGAVDHESASDVRQPSQPGPVVYCQRIFVIDVNNGLDVPDRLRDQPPPYEQVLHSETPPPSYNLVAAGQ